MSHDDIRLALPSKGRIAEDTLAFLADCGLAVYRPNPRQYAATIPTLPGLTVMFQRPGDIAVSVALGSVDFGITGRDIFSERYSPEDDSVLVLHDALGFSPCRLCLAVPESWTAVDDLSGLRAHIAAHSRPVRVATKFPRLTGRFLDEHELTPFELVLVEGTLEIAPQIGYADMIADLVSTGTTLRDNHLKTLAGGVILNSEAMLIAHRESLGTRPEVLGMARDLIEYIEAHLRAQECFAIFANMRGETPEEIARRMFAEPHLSGLQGPTISPIVPNPATENGAGWYAVHIVVRKAQLSQTIAELRAVGGSGVIVSPVTYIFEEEPERYRQMVAALT